MSKRVITHPQPPKGGDPVKSWRSPREREGIVTPLERVQLEREFPNGDTLTEEEQKLSRRNFSKLMGASSALAGLGLASCRRPESYIVPYKKAPEWIVPGKPLFYASTRPTSLGAVPLVVTTYEGRPTKIEPNKEHPDFQGTDAITQASILDLYSPSRSQLLLHRGKESTKADFFKAIKGLNLAETAIVFGSDDSPTRSRMAKDLAAKGAKVYRYETLDGPGLGEGKRLVFDFKKATRILSLDCDFLGMESVGNTRDFSANRMGGAADYKHEIDKSKMNRLYQVETQFSITGGLADHRLRVTPSRVAFVASAIAQELGLQAGSQVTETEKLLHFPGGTVEDFDAWIKACAADLKKAGSNALVLAGSRHSAELQQLALLINQKLGSLGSTVKVVQGDAQFGTWSKLSAAVDGGQVKNLILLTPADPAYDAPNFGALREKLANVIHWGLRTNATAWTADWHVPAAHYLESWGDARTNSGTYSILQPLILPLYGGFSELEILVLLSGRDLTENDLGEAMREVRTTYGQVSGKTDADSWRSVLREGFAEGTSYAEASLAPAAAEITLPVAAEKGKIEVVFATDSSVWDGRFIDNAWLQEAPDPVSKLTWDNAAQISPRTARDLGIFSEIIGLEPEAPFPGDVPGATKPFKRAMAPEIGEGQHAKAPMITVEVNGKSVTLPALLAYGHADNAITLPLGYGQAADDDRSAAHKFDRNKPVVGDVGLNTGFNVYPLRSVENPYFATDAKVTVSDERYPVALTQEHHSMYGRALAREISTADVDGKGDFETQQAKVKKQGMDSHAPPNITLYESKGGMWSDTELAKKTTLADEIHQWGMAIDLNTCTGCNACLVACQAENNIPVVGKEQVAMGREMHWIRMDRYFSAMEHPTDHGHVNHKAQTPDWVQENPESIPQPVACVQCEMAPCETVCPVNATVHTEEGLNSMAYNRCIGTRYCANNCPYKARRFNFFDYNKRNPLVKGNLYKGPFGKTQQGEAPSLQKNPNVTVRMRGVMEKCTYCVQRLELAKIKQKQAQKAKTLAEGKPSPAVAVNRVEDLRVPTDSVSTACQDACPTGAVTFGNLLNDDATVVRAKGNEMQSIQIIKGKNYKHIPGSARNYDLLNYINTRPRTSYLARVKNPNPAMPDAKFLGQATIHLH